MSAPPVATIIAGTTVAISDRPGLPGGNGRPPVPRPWHKRERGRFPGEGVPLVLLDAPCQSLKPVARPGDSADLARLGDRPTRGVEGPAGMPPAVPPSR